MSTPPKAQPDTLPEKIMSEEPTTETQNYHCPKPWEEALKRLTSEDRERFDLEGSAKRDHLEVLQGVLTAANEKKEESLRKRWRIVRGKKTIIIRDTLEKVAVWVNTFIVRFMIHCLFVPRTLLILTRKSVIPWSHMILATSLFHGQPFVSSSKSVSMILKSMGACYSPWN